MCIAQYMPKGLYQPVQPHGSAVHWLIQALGYCEKYTPEHLLRECTEHVILAHSAIRRQAQTRALIRMHLVRAHVMPYHTVTLQN